MHLQEFPSGEGLVCFQLSFKPADQHGIPKIIPLTYLIALRAKTRQNLNFSPYVPELVKSLMVCSKYLDAFKLLCQYLKHTQSPPALEIASAPSRTVKPNSAVGFISTKFISTYYFNQTTESLHICSTVILLGGHAGSSRI